MFESKLCFYDAFCGIHTLRAPICRQTFHFVSRLACADCRYFEVDRGRHFNVERTAHMNECFSVDTAKPIEHVIQWNALFVVRFAHNLKRAFKQFDGMCEK